MRQLIACTLLLITVFGGFGHTLTDSVKVYFNINRALFDPALGENTPSMEDFLDRVRSLVCTDDSAHVDVYGYASPDGPLKLNERLARNRCDAIAAYIIKHTGISPERVKAHPEGVAWQALRRLVEATPDVPARGQVLDILSENPSVTPASPDRLKRLMALADGKPYQWMLRHLFPQLRYAEAIAVASSDPQNSTIAPPIEQIDSIPQPDLTHQETLPTTDTDTLPTQAEVAAPLLTDSVPPAEPKRYQLALKTNMLYYGALMPNLELEYLFHDNWSVAVEGNVAWWSNESQFKCYRLAIIDAEVRHWIKPRAPWHGLYVGAFAGGGWYDLENGRGYKGEGGMAGLSVGYMWPIRHNLSLEAGVGAGYMYTRYKEYYPFEGHYLYDRTKALNYFGPLKLKFSIAWRFLDRKKHKLPAPVI